MLASKKAPWSGVRRVTERVAERHLCGPVAISSALLGHLGSDTQRSWMCLASIPLSPCAERQLAANFRTFCSVTHFLQKGVEDCMHQQTRIILMLLRHHWAFFLLSKARVVIWPSDLWISWEEKSTAGSLDASRRLGQRAKTPPHLFYIA